jgi:hypothetical protein
VIACGLFHAAATLEDLTEFHPEILLNLVE